MPATGKPIIYNDLYFRIIAAIISAHIIVVIGEDETFFHLLVDKDYYRAMLYSFIIAFLLVNLVYWITRKLDNQYDWKQHKIRRPILQLFFSFFLPSIAAFLLAFTYFKIFGYDIWNTWYLRYDYPIIVLMLLMLNIYYLAFYFYRQWQFTESMIIPVVANKEESKSKGVFVVQKGAKNIPLQVDTISYFFHNGDFNFVRTFEQEDFIITQALDDVQQQLNEKQFFRANRQTIINFNACQHFEPLEHGKLELYVTPKLKEPIIISQKRAKTFKEWLQR